MTLPGNLRSFVNRSLALLFVPLLAAPGAPALADERRWFQVELIAFARNWDDSGAERWPRKLQLEYPDHWVVLQTPEELTAQREAEALAEHIRRGPLSSPLSGEDQEGEALALVPEVDLAKEPFIQLPADQRDLNRFATALDRRGEYRVLFHEAWRQPMLEEEAAPWILISAGEEYEPYRELEGSIKFSASRFLHLNTKLWLTEFATNNYGQELDGWPEAPLNPARTDVAQTDVEGTGTHRNTPDRLRSNERDLEQRQQASFSFLDSPYRATRIATLEQSRRMRSDELHYIDHPLMGLLLRITPYELPPEEEADTAEQIRP